MSTRHSCHGCSEAQGGADIILYVDNVAWVLEVEDTGGVDRSTFIKGIIYFIPLTISKGAEMGTARAHDWTSKRCIGGG